jgi:glucose/arabinose dehydrogenase
MRIAIFTLLLLAGAPVLAQAPADRPGQRFHIKPADLPAPFITPSASNGANVVLRKLSQMPVAPHGYKVTVFAEGLSHARWMAVAPTGEVFLAQPRIDEVTLLIDNDKDGRVDEIASFADGFDTPHGLALHNDHLYIADLRGVWRVPFIPGQRRAVSRPEAITPPGAFGESGGHWTRNIVFGPDGRYFYVAIGSEGNIAEEPLPRASIKRFNADGSGGTVFAHGLRNPVGIAFHPRTGKLFTAVNERDGMGDGLVPDYFTEVRANGFYGWPYAYIGPNPMPGYAEHRPELVKRSIVPDVLFQSHSAPIGMAFANSTQFPPDWRDDAFVALQGSWNAAVPTGYKVVRVPFENGKPLGWYENFVTGFWVDTEKGWGGTMQAQVIGRPAGLALWNDGSLLIADAASNTVWRVSRSNKIKN